MKHLVTAFVAIVCGLVGSWIFYTYVPLSLFGEEKPSFGTTITTIQGSDTLKDSRTTINNNFSALNTGKFELSDWFATTSATQLAEVGTLTAGTWNADTITVPYGGTGSTTLASNYLLLGNGASAVKTVSGQGTSGQSLVSNGAGSAPSWQSVAVNQNDNYTWTGNHLWSGAASSTFFSALDYLWVGRTATTTIQGSTTGTSTIQGFLNILGTNSTSTISGHLAVTATTSLSGCYGCIGGYERVETGGAMSTNNGQVTSITASCSTGKKVLGGGFFTPNNSTFLSHTDGYRVIRNYANTDSSWNVQYYCSTAGTCDSDFATTTAICAYP